MPEQWSGGERSATPRAPRELKAFREFWRKSGGVCEPIPWPDIAARITELPTKPTSSSKSNSASTTFATSVNTMSAATKSPGGHMNISKVACGAVLQKLRTMREGTFHRPTTVTWDKAGVAYLTPFATETTDKKFLFVVHVTAKTLKGLTTVATKQVNVKAVTRKIRVAVYVQFNMMPESFTDCVVLCESGTVGDYALFTIKRDSKNVLLGRTYLYYLAASRAVLARYIGGTTSKGVSDDVATTMTALQTPFIISQPGKGKLKRELRFSRVSQVTKNPACQNAYI